MIYIVVGAGRSGTSNVARILHTKLGVHMGDKFTEDKKTNPDGLYEDYSIWTLNRLLLHGKIGYVDWSYTMQQELNNRYAKSGNWGVKDPILSYFIGEMIGFCQEFPTIIWCKRDMDLVISSMVYNWKNTPDEAENSYRGRTVMLERVLKYLPHIEVDYKDNRLSDDEIIETINGGINGMFAMWKQ